MQEVSFRLWRWLKKIRTSGRRRIDGGHNIVCDVGQTVTVLNVGLRSDDAALSYSGGIGSSSSNVFTNNVGIFAKNGFEEEEKEKEGGEENMEGFVRKLKGFLPMNLPNPKGESFDAEGIEGEGKRSKVVGLKEKLV